MKFVMGPVELSEPRVGVWLEPNATDSGFWLMAQAEGGKPTRVMHFYRSRDLNGLIFSRHSLYGGMAEQLDIAIEGTRKIIRETI